jgi:hypothetical protein
MKRISVHESFQRVEDVGQSSNRSFGLLFVAVFGLVAAYGAWQRAGSWLWWAAAAGILAIVTLLIPGVLEPLNRLWMRLALALSKVVTPVVMAVIFFGTVLPTGLIMRLLRKDPLRLKWDPNARSYWIEREPPGPEPESLKNQF